MTPRQDKPTHEDLFFRATVRSYVEDNPRFLRRDWLAEEVEARLDNPDCRFLLLTAEPGAGKSTFLAQLAYDHPKRPVYFIRRDQRTPLGDVGAEVKQILASQFFNHHSLKFITNLPHREREYCHLHHQR